MAEGRRIVINKRWVRLSLTDDIARFVCHAFVDVEAVDMIEERQFGPTPFYVGGQKFHFDGNSLELKNILAGA